MNLPSRRTFLSLLAVTLGPAALRAPRALAGDCSAPVEAEIGVVPTESDVIPRGEGVLVAILGVTQRSLGPIGEMTLREPDARTFAIGARLERAGQRPISLRTDVLGPGLARLVPTRAPTAGLWRIVSRGRVVSVQFGEAPAPALAAPPELVRVERHTSTSPRGGASSGGASTWITAVVRAPVGAPWTGTITFANGSAGEEAILSRALDRRDAAELFLYTSPGRCAFVMPGQHVPAIGRDVRISTYDLWGRVSARSNAVALRPAP